jgi:hypothetical protein
MTSHRNASTCVHRIYVMQVLVYVMLHDMSKFIVVIVFYWCNQSPDYI